jgi:hypothetical protein
MSTIRNTIQVSPVNLYVPPRLSCKTHLEPPRMKRLLPLCWIMDDVMVNPRPVMESLELVSESENMLQDWHINRTSHTLCPRTPNYTKLNNLLVNSCVLRDFMYLTLEFLEFSYLDRFVCLFGLKSSVVNYHHQIVRNIPIFSFTT